MPDYLAGPLGLVALTPDEEGDALPAWQDWGLTAFYFAPGLLAGLGRARVEIGGLQVGSPSLEDVYLRLTGLAARPEEASRAGATGLGVAIGAASVGR